MLVEYINLHQPQFWMAFGFVILILEIIFLGLATGVLLFAGLSALMTGFLMHVGILPETWLAGFSSFGISSGIITIVLWRPLKRLQGDRIPEEDRSSDFIGLKFLLTQHIDARTPGKTRYSGIEWRVELSPESEVSTIDAGEQVIVTSVDVGVFRVKPVVNNTPED